VKTLALNATGTTVACPLGKQIRLLSVHTPISASAEGEFVALRMAVNGEVLVVAGLNPIGIALASAGTWGIGLTATQTAIDPVAGLVSPVRLTAGLPDIRHETDVLLSVEASAGATFAGGTIFYEVT
jgi:hypothetical protein